MNTKTSEAKAPRRPVGRPPKAESEKTKQFSVYFTPDSVTILEHIPGRTYSEKVNNALAEYAKSNDLGDGSGDRASA